VDGEEGAGGAAGHHMVFKGPSSARHRR
jgi:hypothetical protein